MMAATIGRLRDPGIYTVATAAIALMLALASAAAEYRAYPTAKPSPELKAAADQYEVQIGIDPDEGRASFFTAPDSFDDVVEFYLRHGREYSMPPMPGLDDRGRDRGLAAEIMFGARGPEAKPTGIRVKQAFIIFDDAKDITESRDWLTIIRPIVTGTSTLNGASWKFTPVKTENATAIVRVQKQ